MIARTEAQTIPKAAHDIAQNLPVGLVVGRFCLRLEFAVQAKNFRIVYLCSVRNEDRADHFQDAGFPVNESAVAVKGDGAEGGEVEGGVQRNGPENKIPQNAKSWGVELLVRTIE